MAVFVFTVSMMDGLVVFFTQRLVRIRVVAALPVDFGEQAALRNDHLQMAEYPALYLASLVVSVVVCALAAVQPARRAASLESTAILRGEHQETGHRRQRTGHREADER